MLKTKSQKVTRGACKLCLKDSDLTQSHLIPASVYRLLDAPNAPNPNPVLITSQVIVQDSREIKDYVLCSCCENHLSKEGENWVLPRLAIAETVFLLHDMLKAIAPEFAEPDITAYAGSRSPLMQVNDLTHFALGIFWKASVHLWRYGPLPSNTSKIELGSYGENIRQFLRSEAPFPEHVALLINLMPPPVTTRLSLVPREGVKSNEMHRFSFYVPGILFTLFVGRGLTKEIKDGCFYSNPLHPLLVKELSQEVEQLSKEAYFKAKAATALRRQKK